MPMICSRVLVVGLGLIGSSFSKALRDRAAVGEVIGVSRSPSTCERAVALGVIDRAEADLESALSQLEAGDVVFVATPTLAVPPIIEQCAQAMERGVIVTDGASVKGNVATAAVASLSAKALPNLVLGHPIAGSEKSGVEAVNPKLYVDHRVILTPLPETNVQALNVVADLWRACGAVISEMSVQEHDNVLAATSHLPHVLAFALVDALAQQKESQDIFKFAAGGFKDFTRIASSDPTMWHDIFIANSEAVLARMDQLQSQLSMLRDAIAQGDSEAILASFKRANEAREYFLTQYKNLGA